MNKLESYREILKENSKRGLIANIIVIAFLTLTILTCFFYIYLPIATLHNQTITVPNLEGQTVAHAGKLLANKNLHFIVSDSSYSAQHEPGRIISHYPSKGSLVKNNRKIYLVINTVSPPVTSVPNIIDGSLKIAQVTLTSVGFEIQDTVYQASPHKDIVLGMRFNGKPLSNERLADGSLKLPKGSKLVLLVGDGIGKDDLEMPDLLGKPLDEVELLVQGLSLTLDDPEYVASKAPKGTVIRQYPEPNTKIQAREVVRIWISGQPTQSILDISETEEEDETDN